jgi:dipeptide transport system ATP-binding protein
MTAPVIQAAGLHRHYSISDGMFRKPRVLRAVAGLDFALSPGKTLAVVGESGCGKSTLARMVAMIEAPTEGELILDGKPVLPSDWADLRVKC